MKKICFKDKGGRLPDTCFPLYYFGLTDAVLNGRKTKTRRIEPCLKALNDAADGLEFVFKEYDKNCGVIMVDAVVEGNTIACYRLEPRYKVGEIVAVAQSYLDLGKDARFVGSTAGYNNKMYVKAEAMPHRIRIDDVRIERLQDISDEDCFAEGITKEEGTNYAGEKVINYIAYSLLPFSLVSTKTPKDAFMALFEKVVPRGYQIWLQNPFVFVYTFKLIQ